MPYCRKTNEPPLAVEEHKVHLFTENQWNASNFAAPSDLQWFRDAKYGMFIHFGLSTHHKADLSWGTCHTRKLPDKGKGPIPDEVWQSWPNDFVFDKFNAEHWVATAQSAGFKYIVAITKHHDGFHMWDSAYSEFKVTNTPFKRDYLKELSDACHKAGLPFGIYYSQRDWYHPDYMPADPAKVEIPEAQGNLNPGDPGRGKHPAKCWVLKPGETSPLGKRHHKYIEYQHNVCRELCTKYGKLDIFWWDAAWWGGMFTQEMWDSEALTREIRSLQPGILLNNRCSLPGDFDTPEQELGCYQDHRPWESCMCLESGWSYTGAAPKGRDEIIRWIVNNVCCDGNLLLSWGPKWDGEFDTVQRQRLLEVGAWLKENGHAIYGTRGGPWKPTESFGSVRKESMIYLHVFDWKSETLQLPAIPQRRLMSARLLSGNDIPFTQDNEEIAITVIKTQQVAPDTIIELTMDQSVDCVCTINTLRAEKETCTSEQSGAQLRGKPRA